MYPVPVCTYVREPTSANMATADALEALSELKPTSKDSKLIIVSALTKFLGEFQSRYEAMFQELKTELFFFHSRKGPENPGSTN